MSLTGRWSGILWGTNNGALVADIAQDNGHLLGFLVLTETDGTVLRGDIRGAVQSNKVQLNVTNFTGPAGIVLPQQATVLGQLNPAEGHIEASWETDIGTKGSVVLFKFLSAQVPPPPFANSSKTLSFGPCRLDQTQIRGLATLVAKGVSTAAPGFNVMWNGRSAVKSGLDEVIADDNIPSVANEMVVAVVDTSNNQVNRAVTVTFKKEDLNLVVVSGSDSTWVEGKAAEVMAFLSRSESRLWRFLKKYGSNLNSLIFLFMLAVLPSIPSLWQRTQVVVVTSALLLALYFFWRFTPHAKLFLREAKPSWYEVHSGTLWISVLTAILGALIGYLLNRYWPIPLMPSVTPK